MKLQRVFRIGTAASFIGFVTATAFPGFTAVGVAQNAPTLSSNVSVFATGFNNPRGLTFGPDGNLYVAEGGTGGSNSTVGSCTQVPAPGGPYTGSPTGGRISVVSASGVRSTITDALPSDQTSPALGSLVSGVASVAFVGNTLYALVSGGGCSHGNPTLPNGVYRVDMQYGTPSLVANLGSFEQANPTKTIEPDDFEPDGTWYSMVAVNGMLYAVDPNHGEIDTVNPATGVITRLADISATQGHIVPTSLAYNSGNLYVGNLGTFPITPGSEKILQVTPSGVVTVVATGLTTVVGLAFDQFGNMYALETATNPGLPGPSNVGTGMIVKVTSTGSPQTIASGLTFPTGMTFGPDGNLYVSQSGFGLGPGAGQVLKVVVPQGVPLSATVVGSSGRGAGRFAATAN